MRADANSAKREVHIWNWERGAASLVIDSGVEAAIDACEALSPYGSQAMMPINNAL